MPKNNSKTAADDTAASLSSKPIDRVIKTARTARDKVTSTADSAVNASAKTFDENPFGALAGAIAVGAVAAAMIPATRRELEALGPWTEKMRESLVDAFDAAKTAGTGELSAAGLSLAAASDGVGGMVGKLVKAVTVASSAAASSVKTSRGSAAEVAAPPVMPIASPSTDSPASSN